MEEQKKTLQVNENVQKVLGFDNSKANNEPPIGAPKAADTPAAAPIAKHFLLSLSFLKFFKNGNGIYKRHRCRPSEPFHLPDVRAL